ncbi:hypothetical protein JVX98_07955 [Ensifer sp. PDNC004]|uniref:hypothetical protein n=1 Tax=Ensifer sp. PDNC004 TaxID=2811423 RepID=UPI0019647E21|nr:hypothetical protein [Ensifer sp. PDNC004]QRY68210.1 hypothetical protein JVX98_07955 [Ensifer sp. PDNC004]
MWPRVIAGGLMLAGITWLVIEIREDGARSVTTKIERQNNASGDAASNARSDFDLCLDRGGVWDYGAGKCRRSQARGRH